jgi:hypothetical protein
MTARANMKKAVTDVIRMAAKNRINSGYRIGTSFLLLH